MRVLISALLAATLAAEAPFVDKRHESKVLGEPRNYRLILPPDYATSGTRYPVIYYVHGHSDRYTVESYDQGRDTIPKMIDFVKKHDAIVVCVDGYDSRTYTGLYGGDPWDLRIDGGKMDFGAYFLELSAHIDANYRTRTSRRFRATSGLSMGGFLSLWLAARYPDRIGSASSFNPGPEFYAGDAGRRLLWRPKDHAANLGLSMVRLIRASGDYISQYHEETRETFARSLPGFEFRQDEYHRHWATSIGETFDFHLRAFDKPELDAAPVAFSHHSAYRNFEAWGWRFETDGDSPGYTILDDVSQGGLGVRTIRYAPDGPPIDRRIAVTTPPLYRPGATYRILGERNRSTAVASTAGRRRFDAHGATGIAGPGTGSQPPRLLPLPPGPVWPDRDLTLPLRVFNPRGTDLTAVSVELTSQYPTAAIAEGKTKIDRIPAGSTANLPNRVRFTSGAGELAPTRLTVRFLYDGWQSASQNIDLLVVPSQLEEPEGVEILDGRQVELPIFVQAGNRGGGSIVARKIKEGKGNGNGILEAGEEATVWVKLRQGLDPFDKHTWHRARVWAESGGVEEVRLLEESKQREWTGAQSRTSVIALRPNAALPANLLLETESWSFHWTPDARFGPELLYQAFQRHRRHYLGHHLTIR